MFDTVVAQLRDIVAQLDPAVLSGPLATRALDDVAELTRLAHTAKALLAARAAETNQWRHGPARSPEDWLARRTGTSVGEARRDLEVAGRLAFAPGTEAALRSGELTIDQATAVADAAGAAPEHEGPLLDLARRTTLRALRNEAQRIKAAALPDDAARHERIRRERSLRHWVAEDGTWHLHANGTKETGATFMARLQPLIDAQFRSGRAEGRQESPDAYAYDALMELPSSSGGSSKPVHKVIVRADLAALRRGELREGEVCEIAGFGPVPVDVVRSMLGASATALVLTNGVDVVNVTHLGRSPTAHQQTALEWLQPECAEDGCTATVRLERDHRIEWSVTKHTRLDELDRLCPTHHRQKTVAFLTKGPP
jgi:hypothetical protein